jgi:Fungal protein kinase
MMYHRDTAGKIIGVLTDFDLAVALDVPVQDEVPQKLHGTAPFMPQALQSGTVREHTLQDDFESALYILAWVAVGYKCGKPSLDVGDPLGTWREGSWEDIAERKQIFLLAGDAYDEVVGLARPEYKCLLKPIEKLRAEILLQMNARRIERILGVEVSPFDPSLFFEYLDAK